jgi:hypothetical protein
MIESSENILSTLDSGKCTLNTLTATELVLSEESDTMMLLQSQSGFVQSIMNDPVEDVWNDC